MAISTAPSTGARGSITFGSETNFGSQAVLTHLLSLFTTESLSNTEEQLRSNAITGDRSRGKSVQGSRSVAGDLNFELSASGVGQIFYQALGDYIKVATSDGGYHGRMTRPALLAVSDGGAVSRDIVVLSDEMRLAFPANALVAVVARDASGNLVLDDNAGAGYSYDVSNVYDKTYVVSVDAADVGLGGGAVVSVTLAAKADGSAAGFNPLGGLARFGINRTEIPYIQADFPGAGVVKLYLDPTVAIPATPATHPSANDIVIGSPGLAADGAGVGFGAGAIPMALGSWVLAFDASLYAGVFTHYLEVGRRLPVGMSVEVDRDAAIFLYTGCKVNTLALDFQAKSIATCVASLVGQAESSITYLIQDVLPQANEIFVNNALHFPASGIISIGERTNIQYGNKEELPDGTWRLYTIPDSGADPDIEIDRLHLIGENVDCRTSRRISDPIQVADCPLVAQEVSVYVNGFFEEALSAGITLNNNMNTDKYGLGFESVLQLVEQRVEVTAQIEFEFDDGKNYIKFLEKNRFALEVQCVARSEEAEIGNSGIPHQAYFLMPSCTYDGTTPNIEGEEYITHTMPVSCDKDTTLGTRELVVLLVNGLSQDVIY